MSDSFYRVLKIPLLLSLLWAGTGVLLPLVAKRPNCEGNNAAQTYVSNIASIIQAESATSPNHSFDATNATPGMREMLTFYSRSHRVQGAGFLVWNGAMPGATSAPQIIVVCDTPYRNVPEKTLGSAPPTHAAAWSDGNSSLITPEAFARLYLSKFTALDELCPPKQK